MTPLRRRLVAAVVSLVLSAFVAAVATPAIASEEELRSRGDILIRSDDEFDAAHGVVDGSGTPADPYVISGWQVHRIHIADTSRAVVIKDNAIHGQMILNWNGPNVTVVRNKIGDLRVNQNVKRTGAATGGRIAHNSIGRVGQLRHFDGVFEHNVVKPGTSFFDPVFGGTEAVQFDGFNGAVFRQNTLYGALDVKLHGHHHGSDFGATSHHHGHEAHHENMDHTKRYHQVLVTDNTIYSTGNYALRWTDTNHRGDDRTAASEENAELNQPHVHWTRVHLTDNRLVGSGLYVDVFNADDQNHTNTERGLVHIAGNLITLERAETESVFERRHGIHVWNAKDINLRIEDNKIASEIDKNAITDTWERPAGILLEDIDLARIEIADNDIADTYFGVRGSYLSETVDWWITGLSTTGVSHDVYYDQSVENPPRREP